MRGISFQYSQPVTLSDPNRMDIACFIGFVHRRKSAPLAERTVNWLAHYQWLERASLHDNALLDVPIPIESWESFDQLFAWEKRLDSDIIISSDALAESISINDDNQLFKIVINSKELEIKIDKANYTPATLATALNEKIKTIEVTAQSIEGESFLVFKYQADNEKAQLTIFTHTSLGFNRAISRKNDYLHSYLGASVRAFFAQGGRKCYVIRMGDPLALISNETQRVQQLGKLLTGLSSIWSDTTTIKHLVNTYIPQITAAKERPEDWHSIAFLSGLNDVSYLSLPDLPELLAQTAVPASYEKLPYPKEVFVECTPELMIERNNYGVISGVPKCSENGYLVWSRIIKRVLRFIRTMNREVHLIASLPMAGDDINQDFKAFILESWFQQSGIKAEQDIRSAFLQLAYPWLKTEQSDLLPDQALPPEGALTGMLAANALSRGVFNSAAGNNVVHAYDLFPIDFFTPGDESSDAYADFYKHVSVFARVPGAVQLISDVTFSLDERYRPAVVSRLMSLIIRAARNQGQSTLFEPMSHVTWRAVEKSLASLLMAIFNAGGLRGRTANDAFSVQCNESTMTRNDMDNGRLIANVSFQPAIPVQRIQVALSLEQGGQVILQGAA